jgi:hypothetical protein
VTVSVIVSVIVTVSVIMTVSVPVVVVVVTHVGLLGVGVRPGLPGRTNEKTFLVYQRAF